MTIDGSVTVPSGAFSSSTFDQGFAIQDRTGEVHSFVSASTGIDVSGLSPGQTIEVTGFSSQFANDFEVDPRIQDDIRVIN